MIRIFTLLIFVLVQARAQSGKFVLSNTSGVSRVEDPVILSRETVAEFVDIPSDNKVAVLSQDGKEIPCQLDDLNDDGRWDELVFLATIERNTRQDIRIRWVSPDKAPWFQKRTHGLLAVDQIGTGNFLPVKQDLLPDHWQAGQQAPRYQLEGPAIENEQIAFRYFFDSRNTIDVLGKNRPILVLDSAGKGPCNPALSCTWGSALLHTPGTMGLGGFAWMLNGMPVPLRKSQTAMARILADGPVRSIMELVFEAWQPESEMLNVRQRIGIWAGKQWCFNELMISGFSGDKELAIGLTHSQNANAPVFQTHNKYWVSLSSHGKQSVQNDGLGLGLLFNPERFNGYGQLPFQNSAPHSGDTLSGSIFAKVRVRSGELFQYLTFTAWEGAEARFGNARYFLDLIQEEADRREYPLKVLKK